MAGKIQVPAGFRTDFDLAVQVLKLTDYEAALLRDRVRADFATWGAWVQWTAQAHAFARGVWGRLPSVNEALAYLAGFGEDAETLRASFSRLGPVILARKCGEYAGVLPAVVLAPAQDADAGAVPDPLKLAA